MLQRLSLILIATRLFGCAQDEPQSSGASRDASARDLTAAPDLAGLDPPVPITIDGAKSLSGYFDLAEGFTSDNFIIATEKGRGKVAVSLDAVSAELVSGRIRDGYVRGRAALEWSRSLNPQYANDMYIWTEATKLVAIATSSVLNIGEASADGAFVFFTDNATSSEETGDILVARTDGTGRYSVGLQVPLATPCVPVGKFIGHRLFVNYCVTNVDAGITDRTVVMVDLDSQEVRVLKSNAAAAPFSVDDAAALVLVADTAGYGWLVSTTGGADKKVDANVVDGWIEPSGSAVVIATASGSIRRVNTSGDMTPYVLVERGGNFLLLNRVRSILFPAVSDDRAWTLYSQRRDIALGENDPELWLSDLFLTSTVPPNSKMTLSASTDASIIGAAFTSDSTHVLYRTQSERPSPSPANLLVGVFQSMSVMGGPPVVHGTRVSVWQAAQGSKVVFCNNYRYEPLGPPLGRCDLYWVDTDGQQAPHPIAPRVEANVYVTPDKKRVVFSVTRDPDAGIFAFSLP